MKNCLRLSAIFSFLVFLSTPTQADDTPRLHKGQLGDLSWEIFFTMPSCSHDHEPATWCTRADASEVNDKAGVIARMLKLIRSPATRHVYLASYSFSNDTLSNALCDEAKNRGLKVHMYVDKSTFRYSDTARELRRCSPNVKVIPRGTGFGEGGNGYIQHAKMMMATAHEDFLPLSELAARRPADAAALGAGTTTFVSTSANLSSVGFGLNFENWIFFETPFHHHLAQQNMCFFYAMDRMSTGSDPNTERESFSQEYAACQNAIAEPAEPAIEFYPVPHAKRYQQAYKALRTMLDEAKTSIKVGVHRLSTNSVAKPLLARRAAGIEVTALFDDDTLRTGKCNGGTAMPMSANEVAIYRTLRDSGMDVRMMQTNGGVPHMYHDKFVIADDTQVFVGAGNFTSSSLNVHEVGNFEQFYLLRDPAMVKAYVEAWDFYMARAPRDKEQPAYQLVDRGIVANPEAAHPGLFKFDDAPCETDER